MSLLELKQQLVSERGYACECCGELQIILHAHHALYHRMKGKPELDTPMNIALLCESCHANISSDFRYRFVEKQVERYGRDAFEKWMDSLSLKVKRV
jgi:hypothetical protein